MNVREHALEDWITLVTAFHVYLTFVNVCVLLGLVEIKYWLKILLCSLMRGFKWSILELV